MSRPDGSRTSPPAADLAADRRMETGPFDIIGDVHGCTDELEELLEQLGYRRTYDGPDLGRTALISPPPGRRLVFVGDLVDRGPRVADALRIAIATVASGAGFCVPGNHDAKLVRWLSGRNVVMSHGIARSVEQLERESADFRAHVRAFIEGLPTHLWLDGGALAVAHAGILAPMLGRGGGRVREFCLYGDTDGKTDANGLAIRYHWALDYADPHTRVVYGHTPVTAPEWVNGTLCIDTGCCFGGALTALRWPEGEIVSVPARRTYAERHRPFGHPPPRPAIAG